MLVVPDIQDVYTPRQTDLLVSLTEVNISLPSLFQLGHNFLPHSIDKPSILCLNFHIPRAVSHHV